MRVAHADAATKMTQSTSVSVGHSSLEVVRSVYSFICVVRQSDRSPSASTEKEEDGQ